MSKHRISRRAMLKGAAGGAAVAIGLPPLEAMLNANGTALAQGTALPKIFGTWTWGNGVKHRQWDPTATGRGWAAPASLKPFADVGALDQVSVVTNLYLPIRGFWAHHTTHKTLFAAAAPIYPEPNYKGYPGQYGGPKFDDVIKNAVGGKTRFNGVSIRVSRAGYPYLTGDAKSPQHNPQALYDQLFGSFNPQTASTAGAKPPAWLVPMRKSMLDVVKTDAGELRNRLGTNDRRRLDQHLESLRGLERNVELAQTALKAGCQAPARSAPRPADMPGRQEPLKEVNRAMADLLAYALACDLTRTFTFAFSGVQSEPVFWMLGITDGHHALGHNESGEQPLVQKTVLFMMEELAYLVGKLKAIPMGSGTLLDQCCLFGTSEQDDPRGHGNFNIPTLIIGRAGGALKGGVHHKAVPSSTEKRNPEALHTRVLLTVMRAMGLDQKEFGKDENASTSSIAELAA